MALSTGLSLAKTLVFKIMRIAPQAQWIWRGGLWRYAGSIAPVRQISLLERCESWDPLRLCVRSAFSSDAKAVHK